MDWIERELAILQDADLLRSLRTVDGTGPWVEVDGRRCLLLCSNNYLGLAQHPLLAAAAIRAVESAGTGSGASRLVSGSLRLHAETESVLAAFKRAEGALLFNSGFAANTGIIPALAGEGDLIFSDELNHASIVDGCRLSRARTLVYPHRDVAALEGLLAAESSHRRGRWLIVSDTVFSMDGDLAPLPELVRLKEQYDALLLLDDAHGTGVLGTEGRGAVEHFGLHGRVDLQLGTLGKALGGFGAFVAGRRCLLELLVNRARPLIFSTSLPPAVLGAAQAAVALTLSAEGAARRRQLAANARCFTAALLAMGLSPMHADSHIAPVLTGAPGPTRRAAAALLADGILLQGIRPPTVPAGTCRLRATLMADHQPTDLQWAAAAIARRVAEAAHD